MSFRNEGLWPQDSVRDAAESLGLQNVPQELLRLIADDVEFRLFELIEESLKYMRHAKRTKLKTEDVDYALKGRNIEPLWGFNSLRPTTYRRINTANGNIYVVDDEEVDLSKILKGKLPDIPRDVSFTAHWLAIEGVQPSIPQNPSSADIKALHPQPTYTSALREQATTVRPLVRHTLSKELQLYFSRFTTAALSSDSAQRLAALSSLRNDNGLQQLVPYFCRWFASEVTASLDDLSVLDQILTLIGGLLQNPTLSADPYIHQLLPSILSILLSSSLPLSNLVGAFTHRDLRTHAAQLLSSLLSRYGSLYPTIKNRLLLTFLRALVAPTGGAEAMEREEGTSGDLGTRLGAVLGIETLGREVVRNWMGKNLVALGTVLESEQNGEGEGEEDNERERLVDTVIDVLRRSLLPNSTHQQPPTPSSPSQTPDFHRLSNLFGPLFASRIYASWSTYGSSLARELEQPSLEDAATEAANLAEIERLLAQPVVPEELLGGGGGDEEEDEWNARREVGKSTNDYLEGLGLGGVEGGAGEDNGLLELELGLDGEGREMEMETDLGGQLEGNVEGEYSHQAIAAMLAASGEAGGTEGGADGQAAGEDFDAGLPSF
ncbi:TAF-domain-containing protein [Atractiella rhizophila]|nr:TAF-domain-containing protein [Atractiella rhizophila]